MEGAQRGLHEDPPLYGKCGAIAALGHAPRGANLDQGSTVGPSMGGGRVGGQVALLWRSGMARMGGFTRQIFTMAQAAGQATAPTYTAATSLCGRFTGEPWISFLLKRPSLISGYTGFATRASRAGVALELISSRFTSEKRATEGCSPALPVWPAGATDYHSENRLLIHLGMHLLAPGSSGPKATGPSGCDLALEARSGKRRPKRWTSWPCRQRFTPRRQAQEENAPRRTLSPRHTVRSTTASRPTIWSPCRPGPPCPDPAQLPPLPRGG